MFIPQSVNPLEEHAGEKENIGRSRKRNFVLFGDTISWKFAFYGQIHDDTLAHFELCTPWIEVACLSARQITRMEQWPRQYWSFPVGSSRYRTATLALNRR